MRSDQSGVSRREVLRTGVLSGAAFALHSTTARAASIRARAGAGRKTPSAGTVKATSGATYDFNQGWRFGGAYVSGAQEPGYSDARFARVNVPHTVTPLSWGDWDPATWERVWIYRKQFSGAKLTGGRVLLDFDGVMTEATVYLNGIEMAQHQGGFLPWSVELTDELVAGDNVLAVVVDGRWLQVPPAGNAGGPNDVDYLMPAGIYRDVALRLVPDAFISDVFARPTGVLTGSPGLEVQATIDAATAPAGRLQLTVELLDGTRTLAARSLDVSVKKGSTIDTVTLSGLSGVTLWSPTTPQLYTVRTTLSGKSIPSHTVEITTGFRQATFETGGFYLNGQRLQIFGINRHQLFPYTGMAAPQRLQARDAELIKNELNCNMVRCSHYPQSPHFLDACDQIGLMVWEEPPGWQYVGDPRYQALVLQNVHDMVVRDRSRPSVVVWGTRLDETSSNYDQLYAEARALAYSLDGTRQTTGALASQNVAGWAEDVFAYDDYHSSGGNAILEPPLTGIPYMVSEAVGSLDGPPLFRWIDSSQTLGIQALMHAQVQDIAMSNPAYAGLLAWCTVDYDSQSGGDRIWLNLKWGGVLDTFRVPKPGASFYRSQVSTATPVIFPAFYWDFGPGSPSTGPGANAMIATNCDMLQLYLDGQLLTTATPDTTRFANLPYPPVFVNLTVTDGSALPTLQINGYVGGKLVASLQMSSNTATDHLSLDLEDASIEGNGFDATRFTFRALDAYGNQRPYVDGNVALVVKGPAVLVGQNPFNFSGYGGVGGAYLRSEAGRTGEVSVTASHPTLGAASATLKVTAATGKYL
jgi:beta-galactosidase